MGWFQRLFSGADDHDAEYRGTRSPDQARVSAEDLAGELRALHNEIKLLRESIGSGGRSIADGEGSPRRSRRGGRNRSGGRDRDRNRDGSERGRDGDRSGREQRVGFDGERSSGRDNRPQRRSLPKTPPDDAPVGLLVDYLKSRGVVTFEGQDDLNRNEAFEHLARHLGMHFHLLANFYEKVKRCVATGRGQRIDIDSYTHAERSAAVQFGTLLHRHGMLKDFYYHRSPKKQLRVIPTKDGQVGQFLTGGWLEIYVSAVLTRRLRAAMSSAKFQLLYNVKGVLPDGREFEADLMAAVEGRLFWLECKTGQWQDYSARFRGLVKIFGVERESAALLLIKSPDANTRARATDMLDMTLLSLEEVDDFISVFLGEPVTPKRDNADAVERRSISKELGNVPPLTEEEIPLEDAEPAKKLGVVDLNGGPSTEEGEEAAPRRRRRRRRGGRNRGRSGAAKAEGASAEAAAPEAGAEGGEAKTEEGQVAAKKGNLLEPLPIERFDDEGSDKPDDSGEASADGGKAESSEAKAAEGESSEDAPAKSRRSRHRRRPTPFAAEGGEEGTEGDQAKDADGEAKASKAVSAKAEAAAEDSADNAEASSEPVEGGAEQAEGERPKRKRSRRRRSSKPKEAAASEGEGEEAAKPEAVEVAEAAEVAEEAAAPAEESTPEIQAEATESAEAAEEQAEPEEEPVVEEEVVAEAEPEVAPEPEPEPEVVPVKSATGVTIAPDLAAMMAGSKKSDSNE